MPHHEYTEETQAKMQAMRELIEQMAKEIDALQSVSKEMARVGMQQRNDLADARKQIEAFREAVDQERERCATLCDWLPVSTGFEGKTFAEAIRGKGLGGKLAKGFEEFWRNGGKYSDDVLTGQ